jgi:raffinose/stachyose/melibiose transport system permease protein
MDKTWKWLGIGFLLTMIVIQLIPFYIALTVSFKPKSDLSSRWLPPRNGIYLQNYEVAIDRGRILNAIKNSTIVTTISTFFVCVIGAFAAYPLARIKSRLNMFIILIILGVMMVPPLSVLVPLYTMMNRLEAVNTYWGIILIMITGQLPLSIFLFTT